MTRERILASWVGHTDVRAMGSSLSPDRQKKLSAIVGPVNNAKDAVGPIRTLLDIERFDQVHLLSNYPAWVNREFKKWALPRNG